MAPPLDPPSLVREFRSTEQQRPGEVPAGRRPPTTRFLAVALLIGLMVLGFSVLVMSYEPPMGDGGVLSVSEPTESTASTSPTPTQAMLAAAQEGPRPEGDGGPT